MFRLFESIRLQDGRFYHLEYHQQRMDRSVWDLSGRKNSINLFESLQTYDVPQTGRYKCRVTYSDRLESVEFIPYTFKHIGSLKLVYDNEIEYAYKYTDRSRLRSLFSQRQSCDDILIIKNGFITDTSFSNIIFFDGVNWVTPAMPLLRGIMRQFLLDSGEITAAPLRVEDISGFKSFRLINAMRAFDGPEIDASKIVL